MFYFQLIEVFVKIFIIIDSMCSSLAGGILMVLQKFIYNSGLYLTTNVYHDFSEGLDD